MILNIIYYDVYMSLSSHEITFVFSVISEVLLLTRTEVPQSSELMVEKTERSTTC